MYTSMYVYIVLISYRCLAQERVGFPVTAFNSKGVRRICCIYLLKEKC